MTSLEILTPVGTFACFEAAVQNGADAVCLEYGSFHARQNTQGFTREEFFSACEYCRLHGVKVYAALNTLISDRELARAAELVREFVLAGADAVLVRDLGVLRMVRMVAPSLPVHASLQMSVHSLDGVRQAHALGCARVELTRELTHEQLAYICAAAPIPVQVTVYGPLFLCHSGQCFMNAFARGRGAQGGRCVEPCRLPYSFEGCPCDEFLQYPLSPKDASALSSPRELRDIGVTAIKIEGNTKDHEYVAMATRAVSDALGRDQDSRKKRIPVRFACILSPGQPALLGVEDDQGHTATVRGSASASDQLHTLTEAQIRTQLYKISNTPYLCVEARAEATSECPGLSLSTINAMRREALDRLTVLRKAPKQREVNEFKVGLKYLTRKEPPVFTVQVSRASQVTDGLLALSPAMLYVPLGELVEHEAFFTRLIDRFAAVAAVAPRVFTDQEVYEVKGMLKRAYHMGVHDVLIGNMGQCAMCSALGFTMRGDFGLNVFNSQTLKTCKRMGLASATLSVELNLQRIRELSHSLDTELIVYGRIPIMISETCLIKNHTGYCSCDNVNELTDRDNARFPVQRAYKCRNVIYNARKLFLADRWEAFRRTGLWAARLLFTTENPRECVQVAERYLGRGQYEPNGYTRGAYFDA